MMKPLVALIWAVGGSANKPKGVGVAEQLRAGGQKSPIAFNLPQSWLEDNVGGDI
jgi:hypothetical protein